MMRARQPEVVVRHTIADSRLAGLAGVVARVECAARGITRLATIGALAAGAEGLVVWWLTSGHHLDQTGQGALVSLVVLALCLAPAGWLINVRFSLLALLRLPGTLGAVTARRGVQLAGGSSRSPGPVAHNWSAVRSLRSIVRDYGDVVGSWAAVTQVITPTFWALTALALLAVPVLVAVAAAAALVTALA